MSTILIFAVGFVAGWQVHHFAWTRGLINNAVNFVKDKIAAFRAPKAPKE